MSHCSNGILYRVDLPTNGYSQTGHVQINIETDVLVIGNADDGCRPKPATVGEPSLSPSI